MRGNPDGAPSWSRSFSSQGRLSPTSLSTDLHAHTQTPVYTQVQLVSNSSVLCPVNQCDCIRENSNTDKSTFENIYKKNSFKKKKFFFCFQPQTRERSDNTGSMQKIWKQKTPLSGSDLHLDKNTCSVAALALSPSVLFCFMSFSVKIIWE